MGYETGMPEKLFMITRHKAAAQACIIGKLSATWRYRIMRNVDPRDDV